MHRQNRLPRLLAALAVGIAAASADSTSASTGCSIRFLNELPSIYGSSSLLFTTTDNNGVKSNATTIDSLSPHSAGAYQSVPCALLNIEVTVSGGSAKLPSPLTTNVNLTAGSPSSPAAFTVYSYLLLNAIPALGSVVDSTALIPSKIGTIDQCALRFLVLDPTTTGATVYGVINQCSENCTKSQLFFGLSGSAPLGYDTTFDCSAHWLLSIVADNGRRYTVDSAGQEKDWSVKPWEHGFYTILVRNASLPAATDGATPSFVILTDVEAPNPYLPLYLVPVALAVLWLAHFIIGRVVAYCYAAKDANNNSESSGKGKAGADDGEVTCIRFWGYDRVIARAKATALGSPSSSSSSSYSAKATGSSGLAFVGATGSASLPLLPSDPEPSSSSSIFGAATSSATPAAAAITTKPKSAGRIRAIDALRGLALVFMIFVNYGAGSYSFLDHAKWNGLNLADLLFPTFVWTQGVSMAIATDAARRRGASKWDMAKKVIIRAIKLYALGCFLNDGIDLSNWRLLGVLQYFAVSSLVVGLMEIFVVPGLCCSGRGSASKTADDNSYYSLNSSSSSSSAASSSSSSAASAETYDELSSSSILRNLWRDLGRFWAQWIVMASLFTLYLCVQWYLPLDNGCPTGYIGAGGLAQQSAYLGKGCTGGAHRKVDMAIFGPWHSYHNSDPLTGQPTSAATCASAFDCDVYDPEGVLGWISACVMTFLGLQAGRVFVSYRPLLTEAARSIGDASVKRKAVLAHVLRWLCWSAVIGITGAALAGFTRGDTGIMPINKNLWSPSFIFVVAGIDFLLLATFFLTIDVWKLWSGAPLAYVGMNSIVVYASHEIFQEYFPLTFHAGPDFASHAEYLTSNIIGVLCWVGVARILYLKKIFVNL